MDYASEPIMVDLGGYVIILVETKDKKIKLYGESALLLVRSPFLCELNITYDLVFCNTALQSVSD